MLHAIEGEVPDDPLGWIARKIGDVEDAHGQTDLLITGACSGCRGEKSGRVWVLSR